MDKSLKIKRSFCILSGLSGVTGVVLLNVHSPLITVRLRIRPAPN